MQLVTTDQAAEMLAISPRMVRKIMDAGQLPPRRIGRALRFDVRDLERLVGIDPENAQERAERP